MPTFRTWTWTRIDGRNVLAMPTRDEIHLYDSEDFILLDKIAPTGHRSYIHSLRWSAFHGKIVSLSSTQLIVHAPQLDKSAGSDRRSDSSERVRFVRICDFDLVDALMSIRSLAFSRCADFLLFGGGPGGIGLLDIRAETQLHAAADIRLSSFGRPSEEKLIWREPNADCDVVKFSPCSFVFATMKKRNPVVQVWRLVRDETADGHPTRRVLAVDQLHHPHPVVYMSWKPATTQPHAVHEYDGSAKARWFEPQRILLTCTKSRAIRVWVERRTSPDSETPTFVQSLCFEPSSPLRNVRWVLSKNRNISEENFKVMDVTDEKQTDWISGVDNQGVLHLYQVNGIASRNPKIRDTELRVKVNGEESQPESEEPRLELDKPKIRLEEICVMAYFSQNYFGMPSKFDIILQRADGIILSYIIDVGRRGTDARVKKRSWYRSHLGSIAALAAHPSLPLLASVDEHRRDDGSFGNEVLIYWISFSAFSAESRLIPSGVLQCPRECGEVLCVQWIPTTHFDATPLFLVAYQSGMIAVYGRAANAVDVVTSPRTKRTFQRLLSRTPSLTPWTFYDYVTGESGIEYEAALQKDEENNSLGFNVTDADGILRVSAVTFSGVPVGQIMIGDMVTAVRNTRVDGMLIEDFENLVTSIPQGETVIVRFRSNNRVASMPRSISFRSISTDSPFGELNTPSATNGDDDASVESLAASLKRSFLATAEADFDVNSTYVHAGSVSMYGGWHQILSARIAAALKLLCVCPVYADDGEHIPDTVLIFAVVNIPGDLSVWKGVHSASSHSFDLTKLEIQDKAVLLKHNITSIAGERDYRQRAFSSEHRADVESGLNSLVFVGDSTGSVDHWRCRVRGDRISFAIMSSCRIHEATPSPFPFSSSMFFRRGYFNTSTSADSQVKGIHHIEVDDPNRIAVLDTGSPSMLHVFEAESGLGILRLEETIDSGGRGRILGFCWCSAHVEFNVDALVVHYESGIVVYQYDMRKLGWVQIGQDILTPLAIFDCSRDSSALLIGGGHLRLEKPGVHCNETEEMPFVLGKWDEPEGLFQHSMDWKAQAPLLKLPVWHPYVVITTLFGMHARVGVKDTALAGDSPEFEFSKAFKDAVQMLKLLVKVLEDKISARQSARSGVLMYTPGSSTNGIVSLSNVGHRDSIGRYSTAIHMDDSLNRAENIFSSGRLDSARSFHNAPKSSVSEKLLPQEAELLSSALSSLVGGRCESADIKTNAATLFKSFEPEHIVQLQAVIHFVNSIQSLGFELDASPADLGAKRAFTMYLFGQSLREKGKELETHQDTTPHDDSPARDAVEVAAENALMNEPPSSAFTWALHSDAQQFLWEKLVSPQATWEDVRPLWLGLWVREIKDLRGIIERLAKGIYTRSRDGMSVALFYIALGKKNILSALAKLSKGDTNKNLSMFLENDFTQERWSNAAIKNAYSLLSKKQYEAAAAFFLLCEPPRLQEALRLLAVRLSDPSLALVVSRLVEYRMSASFQQDFISSGASAKEITPIDAATKTLLREDVVPALQQRSNRWLESCALWWLEEYEQACAILLPEFQPIDVKVDTATAVSWSRCQRSRCVTYFFINLTSIPVYFQYLYSSINGPVTSWASRNMRDIGNGSSGGHGVIRNRRWAKPTDIEHAYSFSAYVCKRHGMGDTSLVDMLQARHLVNLHAKVDIALEQDADASSSEATLPRSPRMKSFSSRGSPRLTKQPSSSMIDTSPILLASPRRMSELNDVDFVLSSPIVKDVKSLVQRSSTINWSSPRPNAKAPAMAPWLRAQIADIECRRWSSSAFVGKLIGLRVAREMIIHFRNELDVCFVHFVPGLPMRAERHRDFLEELCAPLCEQFQVDRKYVLEAALAVMRPHAYLHIAEICFLLAVLGRTGTLTKWIQYVASCMLNSCATFASCRITEDIYRDWESLTIQLCYILHLDAQGQIKIPYDVIAQVTIAVRVGCVFLTWCKHQWGIVQQAITTPFYSQVGTPRRDEDPSEFYSELSRFSFEKNANIIRSLQQSKDQKKGNAVTSDSGGFGYLFLRTIAAHLGGDVSRFDPLSETDSPETIPDRDRPMLRKMYRLILMVSVLRTLYARAQVFLLGIGCDPTIGENELDISSSLFTPRKLWKPLTENPLDGLRRWYSLIESHLRCVFDYSVSEVTCICGLYGLDGHSATLATRVEKRINAFEHQLEEEAKEAKAHKHNSAYLKDIQRRLEEFLSAIGISSELHRELINTSDDYVLLLMRHPRYGVPTSLRRFRVDPRVHIKCFQLLDAFAWFTQETKIFSSNEEARMFLSRCCKQRKLRLLVRKRGDDPHEYPSHEHADVERRSESDLSMGDADAGDRGIHNHAMMFVDPWEVEAEMSVRKYMHDMKAPLRIELGWDRLTPVCTAMSEEIAEAVFHDSELAEMWQATCGEGWLVTSITQYQLDGVHSHRSGHVETRCVFEQEMKVPFLVEVHSRSQRNALFKEVGLPHRFVGVVKVKLIRGRDLIPVKLIEYFSDPYVFLALSSNENLDLFSETWNVHTYRSRCAPGGSNPVWGNDEEDEFTFRFAIPTHRPHIRRNGESSLSGDDRISSTPVPTPSSTRSIAECVWDTTYNESELEEPTEVLESFFQHFFTGPPMFLHCAAFHKTKVFAHQFMGSGKVPLNMLTSGNPLDVWIPLQGVASGAIHVQISLSFQLMCSAVAAHSARSWHQPLYELISEQSESVVSSTTSVAVSASPGQHQSLAAHLRSKLHLHHHHHQRDADNREFLVEEKHHILPELVRQLSLPSGSRHG
ncbi:hypothetical protein PINS_up008650 [Pythium insidiosum]|nr:hypothetical protein PINS_up008650 [Pythium insidiosum]